MMRRHKLLALTFCWLAACATPDTDQLRNELIIPSHAIGLVYLGMPLADLYKLRGQPRETRHLKGTAFYVYNDLTALVDTKSAKQEVLYIRTSDSNFATKELLRVTSPDIRIRSLLGRPVCEEESTQGRSLTYDGIVFLVVNGQVAQVTVRKGHDCR